MGDVVLVLPCLIALILIAVVAAVALSALNRCPQCNAFGTTQFVGKQTVERWPAYDVVRYRYRCKGCGHEWEKTRRVSNAEQ